MADTLAQRVRAKFPGAYDDLSDQQLEAAVTAKFPGAYDDIPRTGATARQPDFRTTNARDANGQPVVNHVADFAGEVGHALNPVEWVKGLYGMASDLVGTAKGMGATHERIYREAESAFKRGDYLTAGRKFVNYLTPIVGPIVDRSADLMAEGKYGKGAGAMVGFGAQLAVPAAVSRIPGVRIPMAPRNVNAAERAAVDFGMREGIPVDAATATGNTAMRGAEWLADRTLGGSIVGGKARQAQAESFARVGERLADRANPVPVTAEQAGQGVRDAVSARASRLNADATVAYDRLRALEAQRPLAVDLAPTKAAMRPTYEALVQENQVVPFVSGSGKGKALVALQKLMDAPDAAPLSIADGALSEIKSMARVDQAFKRTTGQGIAAQAVQNLDRAVVNTARQGGRDVFQALMDGRAATVNKYKAVDLFDALRGEPVQVFNQLTAAKDSAANLIRQVQREAPSELPKVGRAYLEGLIQKATAEGGFGRTAGIFADWQRLGPQAKQAMFRDPALVRELDQFFLLAKKAAENPNASGTTFTASIAAQGALLWTNPAVGVTVQIGGAALAKLLHSPKAVRVLVRGLRIPAGNKAAATAASAELATIARESGVPLAPATVETAPAESRRPPTRSAP